MTASKRDFMLHTMKELAHKDVPVQCVFELTAQCNLDCKMCYIHTRPNREYVHDEKSTDWWLAIIDAAFQAGMLFARLTGGECLIYPGFKTIYTHLQELKIGVSINTNGVALTKNWVDFFKSSMPDEIQVTLYGSGDDAYEAVTGHRYFERVYSNVKYAIDSGLPVQIAITPSTHNWQDVKALVSLAKELGVPYSVNAQLFPAYETVERDTNLSKFNNVDKEIDFLKSYRSPAFPKIDIADLPNTGSEITQCVKGLSCTAGLSAWITWDGYMQPCSVFHWMKYDIDEFLSTFSRMHADLKEYVRPIECNACKYKKVCFDCPELRRSEAPVGHCNPYICELTKRKVAEGLVKSPL